MEKGLEAQLTGLYIKRGLKFFNLVEMVLVV
jgi:hypothetical protein